MPITLTLPEDVLSPAEQNSVFASLTDALLETEGLHGNTFMTSNIIGSINIVPKARILAGGKPVAAAFIELKLPAIALTTLEAKRTFIEKATDIVQRTAGERIRREHIWTNIVYAPEGAWGIAGKAYANGDLVSAITAAAA